MQVAYNPPQFVLHLGIPATLQFAIDTVKYTTRDQNFDPLTDTFRSPPA